MISARGNPPVPDSRRPSLTLGTPPLEHIRPVCSIHIATESTFGFVCILSMIGPRDSAMTTALLAMRIEVADLDGLAVPIQPFNWPIDIIHTDLLSKNLGRRIRLSILYQLIYGLLIGLKPAYPALLKKLFKVCRRRT